MIFRQIGKCQKLIKLEYLELMQRNQTSSRLRLCYLQNQINMTPQRSRSEAPTGNSIGNVLYEEVHKKLMSRVRKLSPAKIQAKQQERQQRAEHLRAKIELSRKEWCIKVRLRQQLARTRLQETVERKRLETRLNLYDRLEQAARNKEAELQNVVEKAKAENVKAEETNFIIKLTKQNQQLDLRNKLSENEERRQMLIRKDMERIQNQELQRKAVEKRREELSEGIRNKLLSKEQKREQAEQRRKEHQIAEKNKAKAEKMKRDLVRARKHGKRHTISDIMSFLSNRESLWEFIGMEQDLDRMGLQFNLGDMETQNGLDEVGNGVSDLNEQELLSMIKEDQFELEKLMLKRDHEILSTCIIENPDGSIRILQKPMTLMQRSGPKRGGPKSSSSGSSILSTEDKKEKKLWNSALIPSQTNNSEDQKLFCSPMKKQDSAQAVQNQNEIGREAEESRKLKFQNKQHSKSLKSNPSSSNKGSVTSRSKDEILIPDETDEVHSQHVSESSKQSVRSLPDEKLEQKFNQQRLKVALRRNILKRNLSEDLVWAAGLQQNPNFEMIRFVGQQHMNQQNSHVGLATKSQTSSLERDPFSDIEDEIGSSLRGKLEQTQTQDCNKMTKISAANLSKKNKNKGKHQSRKSSLHSSGPTGGKDLNNMSQRSKKNSTLQELQHGFQGKQKKTLSNQGSCSSLSGLIKTKLKDDNEQEFIDIKTSQPQGTLNFAQLEQLGPVVKMTINGFPFTQNMSPYMVPASPNQSVLQTQPGTIQSDTQFEDHISQTTSIFSQSTSTGHSFQMNSLIMSQRQVPSKTNLSSVHLMNSSLSKNANLYLFPIREQKIILMYKERETEFHFVQAKIYVKLEEFKPPEANQSAQAQTNSTPQLSSSGKRALLEAMTETAIVSSPATPKKSNSKQPVVEETKRSPIKNFTCHTDTPNSGKKINSLHKNTLVGDSGEQVTPQDEVFDDQTNSQNEQSDRMVDLIVQKLLIEQMQHIRIDDSQKSILFENDKDSQAVLKYLEVNELKFKYCRLCEVVVYSQYSFSSDAEDMKAGIVITEHFSSKAHVRKREGFQIKETEDMANSILIFSSQPGQIELELRKENEKALKRKVRRLKASMQTLAVSHENASTYPGKELKSSNKNRLQIRCIELQKSVFPVIKYETVDAILTDVLKVLEKRGTGDLHLMRKLKFVPTMIDLICKRISTCPRTQLARLAKAISLVIQILTKFCSLRENRNYMIQTNRVMPLIDLLSWCLNRQTELFFSIEFMPGLFQTITTHLKHRVPYECQMLKEHMVDLLISSSIPAKLKNKLAIVKSIQNNENEDSLGQVPFFLLKSVAFLEALTAMISIDARTRPVYEKSIKIGEHIFFVLQSTEMLGIIQMITTLLLTYNETFKASALQTASGRVLPQTILSLTIISIKVLNNMMRMDCGVLQHMMLDLSEQLYHLLSFILSYTETNIDQSDDVKELLHETLIFIGYFCLLNDRNQKMLHRGENSILQKLCNLPFTYFMDKKLKEILFPTLVTASYLNDRSVAIMDQEMNMTEFLVKYIETNIKEELPRIMEQEQEYCSDHTKSMSSFGRARSPSQLSTGSNSACSVQMDFLSGNNPYLPLVMRFPKNLWKDAAQYFKSKAD